MSNPKSPVWYGGGLSEYMHPGMQLGSTFYVNHGGDDANDGLTPLTPFLTLTAAIAACTHDRHDLIVVLNWWLNESCPIVVDKRMVTIVGAGSGSLAQPALQIASEGDTQIFEIAERDVAIHNFILDGTLSINHGCVEFTAGAGMVRQGLYNCYFRGANFGVWSDANSAPATHLCVSGCYFESTLLTDGILIAGNVAFALFRDNIFDAIPGIGINVTGGPGAGMILDNRFILPSNTQGKAITLAGTSVRWMVDGNRANYGVTEMVANPYEDSSAAVNNWLTNWKVTTSTIPA